MKLPRPSIPFFIHSFTLTFVVSLYPLIILSFNHFHVYIYTLSRYAQSDSTDNNKAWSSELSSASALITSLCTFLLSFFVSVVIQRWWSIRDAFRNVQGGVRNITMLAIANIADTDAGRAVRDRLQRYALAVHALVIKTERGDRDVHDLVEAGMLLPAEAEELERTRQREYTLGLWMLLISARASEAGLLVQPIATLPLLQNAILSLRSAAGSVKLYTSTQLPFPYIQLLTTIVKMNLLTIALQYGQEAGSIYSNPGACV